MMMMMMLMMMMTQGVPGDGGLDPAAVGGQLRGAQDEEMRTERCNIVPTIDLQTIQRIIVIDRFSYVNLLIIVMSFPVCKNFSSVPLLISFHHLLLPPLLKALTS